MKRTLALILALVSLVAVTALSVSASPSQTVLAPVVLTPGDSQPITCQYALVGTLASPACPTPTVTVAPVPPTATPAPGILLYNLPSYSELKISCIGGAIPTDLGITGSSAYVLCPVANTPTSTVTATPLATATPSATPTP